MRVLLAGDLTDVGTTLSALLHAYDWQISAVRELGQVRVHLLSDPAELVVVDARADAAGAAACCRSLREHQPTRSLHTVAATADTDDDAVAALLAAGFDDVLLLSASPAELRLRVQLATQKVRDRATQRTPRVRRQIRALRDSLGLQRALLEELFESAPEGIILVDGEDRILRANPEFTRMFGYTEEEAVGRETNDLIAAAELRAEALDITRRVHAGARVVLETVRHHKDGTPLNVSLLATPVRAGEGQVGVYGIYRDITEQKRAEAAMCRSEARYHALFHQAPIGVFLYDRELRVVECNASLLRIFGLTREQVIDRDLATLQEERVLPAIELGQAGLSTFYAGPYRSPNVQHEVWVSARSSPLRDEQANVLGGIVVIEDISDRIRAESQLREQAEELERINGQLRERTQEAEAALQARNRLFTTMNHELRTPVSAIMLYNELLLDGVLGELPPDQREAVHYSQLAAEHLLELIREVLDLAKLEAGKVELHVEPVQLALLLEEIRATVRPLAARSGSEMRLELDGADDVVITDPRRLRQILLNLLSNAVKFGDGQPVVLRCDVGETVRIEVVDHGVGIAEADLRSIFEEFVQVGAPQESGTGLGLAISRRLTQLLGGCLEVESQLGVGSTFRLVLPRQATQPPAPTRREPTESAQ